MTETSRSGPTRERIIAAATGAFRRRGVAATGIGEVCSQAGVTKGVFSHHFLAGKEQLVLEVVRRNRRDVAELFAKLAAIPGRSTGETVAAAFRGYATLLRDRGTDFGCPVAASVVDVSAVSEAVRAAAADAFRHWADQLGGGPEAPGSDLRALVVAAFEGAILFARADNDPAILERIGVTLGGLIDSEIGAD